MFAAVLTLALSASAVAPLICCPAGAAAVTETQMSAVQTGDTQPDADCDCICACAHCSCHAGAGFAKLADRVTTVRPHGYAVITRLAMDSPPSAPPAALLRPPRA